MSKQTIGEFLAALRRAKGFTQQEVADKLSVSNRTVSAWERGAALPDILLLPAIAELYEITTDELLRGERISGDPLPHVSEKSESKIYKNKLAKFTVQACILTGVFCLGLTLFFIGWEIDRFTVAWVGWRWWLLLLFTGLTAAVVCLIVFVALFMGTATACDENSGASFRILLCRQLFQCACVGAAFCLLFALIGIFLQPTNLSANLPLVIVFFAVAIFLGGSSLAIYRRTLQKWGGPLATPDRENGRLLRKLGLFALIPVAMAISLVVVFSIRHPVVIEWAYENEDLAAFTAHVETLEWEGVEYALPLSETAKNAEENVEYELGNGFSCRFFKGLTVCDIYRGFYVDEKESHPIPVEQVYLISTADQSFSLYNVRYRFPIHYGGNTIVDSYYELERKGGGAAYVLKVEHDYIDPAIGGAALLVASDAAVCAVIFLRKRKKINVKL